MLKILARIGNIADKIISLIALAIAIVLIFETFKPLIYEYLNFPRPIGGDYYNGLTYSTAFAKHTPFPPTGWLSFWHEGIPIIGGYPTTPIYLMAPLFKSMDPSSAMEGFMIGSLLLFLVACLILFWVTSHSVALSLILTWVIFQTRGTYYQLFGEGLIAATTAQCLMPLTLIFVYLYTKHKNPRLLITGAVLTGLAILLHTAMGLLTVMFPSLVILAIYLWKQPQSRLSKLAILGKYALISFLVGSIGAYGMFLTMVKGGGSGACNSPQCWGIYPAHFKLWLTTFSPVLAASFILTAVTFKLIKPKKVSIISPLAFSLAFIGLSLYPLVAYFHWIDTFISAIFPRRIFWAINLLLLLIASSAYLSVAKGLGKYLSRIISVIMLAGVLFVYLTMPESLKFDTQSIFNYPGTIPANVWEYITPKYQKHSIDELVPSWVAKKALTENNYRFDSLDQQVNHWWNSVFEMPAIRGYSNSPIGENAQWLYYFQIGTAENSSKDPPELIKNRSLFLIDQFGVGLYEDSARSQSGGVLGYDQKLILDDPQIMIRQDKARELTFYELSPKMTSPIVAATNATPVLVVGDEEGYQTLMRALSLTGITSRQIVPVKGPASIDALTNFELENFPVIFLYSFKGNINKLDQFIAQGGQLIVETGALKTSLPANWPSFFPVKMISQVEVYDKVSPELGVKSVLTTDVDPSKFAQFSYQGGSWKMGVGSQENLSAGAKTLLTHNNKIILAEKQYQQGRVIWSGVNLPYHIITNQNLDEVRLLKNILSSTVDSLPTVNFVMKRPVPENIQVEGDKFRGIFFKENYNSGWHAKSSGKDLSMYKAGLGFMYFPIPEINSGKHLSVSINYIGNLATRGFFTLSVASFLMAIAYIIWRKPFQIVARLLHKAVNQIIKRFKTWFDKEE